MFELTLVLSGLIFVLVLATAAGSVLQTRTAGGPATGVIVNLNQRVRTWWLIVGILAAASFTGPTALIVVFAIVSFLAVREFLTTSSLRAADRRAILVTVLVILPVQYILIGFGQTAAFSVFVPAAAFLTVPIMSALAGDTKNFLPRVSEHIFGIIACVYGLSHVPGLLLLNTGDGRQVLLVAFLLLVAQASDVLQYIWGKLAGRHKIAPNISPNKTVEGLVGGIVSATLIGGALWWLTPFNPAQSAAAAFLISVAGFCGGLIMSAVKRDRGIKDWSQTLAGHGGVLDRVDSLCFSAPLFFYLAHLLLK